MPYRMVETLTERVVNRLRFLIERMIIRGPFSRLIVVAALVALVALFAGAFVYAALDGAGDLGDMIWWAFLRLTDPGYLGDDEGALRRSVSTVVTVLGYVLFMGALIAIMTQWFNAFMRRLESGLTPVTMRDHVVVLGWTNRTPDIARELFESEHRVRRFLKLRGKRRLRVAALVEEADAHTLDALRVATGHRWDPTALILRSGSVLQAHALRRVDARHAAAVILPSAAPDDEQRDVADGRTLKALLSLSAGTDDMVRGDRPLVVAELRDAQKLQVALSAYAGKIEVLASDLVIGRLLAQDIRYPGIARVFSLLLTHGQGAEVYSREVGALAGQRFDAVAATLPRAISLGITRPNGPSYSAQLLPSPDLVLRADDRLILLAEDFEATAPTQQGPPSPTATTTTTTPQSPPPAISPPPGRPHRLLVLGWSRTVPALISELERGTGEAWRVEILSLIPVDVREALMTRRAQSLEGSQVLHRLGDLNALRDLEQVDPASFDHVVLVASDWTEDEGDRDARTLTGFLMLHEALREATAPPSVTVELLSLETAALLPPDTSAIVSPRIVSHMLTQVALRRDLRAAYDALFGAGGADLRLRSPSDLEAAASREVVLGYRRAATAAGPARILLHTERTRPIEIDANDEVIVLTCSSRAATDAGGLT